MSITQRISDLVRAALPQDTGAFRPEPSAVESEAHCQALAELALERLRETHGQHEAAGRELLDARAAVERVRGIIRAADVAAQEASEAETREREAARIWAASGALGEKPAEIRALFDVSRAARRHADEAAVTAEGARQALPGLLQAEQEAQLVLSQADETLRAAVVGVLAARVEPRLLELERIRDAYLDALRPVMYLRHLVRNWGPAHPLYGFGQITLGAELDGRLRDLAIEAPSEPDILGGAHDVLAEAKRLLADPEAK